MDTTRRETIGMLGAAAAAAVMAGAAAAPSLAQGPRKLGSATKTLFWAATVTPCDKNLKFDPGAFRDILAWFKHCGADGVVVLGTTGEYPSFSVAERKLIAETALKNKDGLNVIVGPGTPNFPETLELSRHAQDNGADGLLVIPPFYYNDPPLSGLVRYYSMLFDQIRIPINLYHIPGTSEVPISHDLLKALMHYPNLTGIKDSTGSPESYKSFVADFPELNMRTGTGNNVEWALDHGMGAILADGNVFPDLWAAVFKAFHAGQDYHPALAKLRAASALFRPAGIGSYGPMKYAMSLRMGGRQTYQRPPNADVTDAQMAAIRAAVDQMKSIA